MTLNDNNTESSNTDSNNTPSKSPPSEQSELPLAPDEEELSELGKAAQDHGLTFVFENSEPYRAWLDFRGADGIPIADVKIVGGIRRRGVWMSSLYPPARGARTSGATA
jgi:hypothetical protein